jgi:hypothetical protein
MIDDLTVFIACPILWMASAFVGWKNGRSLERPRRCCRDLPTGDVWAYEVKRDGDGRGGD